MPPLPRKAEVAAEWLASRLAEFSRTSCGDVFGLATGQQRPAAVLAALLWHAEVPAVLLTRRTEGLRDHAGQVSFPGGKLDPADPGAVACALREASEEIALPPGRVLVAGQLPCYYTLTGYAITPVVGIVEPPFSGTPQPGEVAEIFELPLTLALDPTRYERHRWNRAGRQGTYLSLDWQGHQIWGATAAMLNLLAQAVHA
ncbi:CoA pyrophosphatase [Laribacter hongkongensis]|uniref:CoA pyrophosphatase n=1 Tax=Laribacter hongkongensis TaxID=168471 RepID=UPI001EFDAA27|nr:CoA pyrophosphatase [Laribacter hongkongensis]MCG9054811.1 CoA pyrophosphatase [Laribacter hongkongensis]